MVRVPTLTDGQVTLRAHHDDDLPDCLEQNVDPLSQRWTSVPIPYALEDAKRFIRHAMPGGWASDQEWGFAVTAEHEGTQRYAGTVSLRNIGEGRAEIAYGAHPWARGRGIIERALRLLLEWGFTERDVQTVIWYAEQGNWASRKVAWRLGFSCEATLPHWLPARDGLRDCWAGTLHRDEQRLPRNPWLTPPVIHGDRVTLRAVGEHDLGRVVEACSDHELAYFLGRVPQPYGRAEAEQFLGVRLDRMARGSLLHWAVADPETDVLLASVEIFGLDEPSGAEVGYWAHPEARGRGVVTEAVRLLIRHAFIAAEDGGLGLTKLRLVAAVDNAASIRVAEANGFRRVGVERAGMPCRDGMHDAVIYDLIR